MYDPEREEMEAEFYARFDAPLWLFSPLDGEHERLCDELACDPEYDDHRGMAMMDYDNEPDPYAEADRVWDENTGCPVDEPDYDDEVPF